MRWVGGRTSGQMLWGLIDQGCFSATNFGLTVVAARLLGPAGLGQVFVGFTFYLFALTLQRALISDPLVVASAALPPDERQRVTRAATTATLGLATGVAVLTAAVGLILPPSLGQGLVQFTPWILPALLHDHFRTALFRDERGAQAAGNAVAWAVVMAVTMALLWDRPSDWVVVGSWGAGAIAGAVLGLVRTRAWPERPAHAWRWWRNQAWGLGRWLAAESVAINIRLQLNTLLLAGVLGTGGLGGLRAAESLFAFMTLAGPALAMAGLPAVRRTLEWSVRGALSLASRISAMALTIVTLYLIAVWSVRSDAMALVFGRDFAVFAQLVIPIGLGQLLGGAVVGYTLFLKACSAGRVLLWCQVLSGVSTLAFSVGLAIRHGVNGAAWGMALGALIGTIVLILVAWRLGTGHRQLANVTVARAPAEPPG